MSNLSTITQKHQITIPQSIIFDLKLQPNDKVFFETQEDWIKIVPLKQKSFLDLHGIIKSKKKIDFKKLRKEFEKEIGKSK